MMRILIPALALTLPSPVLATSLPHSNPGESVAQPCSKIAGVATLAALWVQLAACTSPATPQNPMAAAKPPTIITQGTKPAWGGGGVPRIYSTEEGAFRFVCAGDGPLKRDDPVVYPGQPGAAHLHQVWGNMLFDADLTTERLLGNAATNCNATPNSHNRSSYWQPALLHDSGQVIRPDAVAVYYKRSRSSAPACDPASRVYAGKCVMLPKGIKYVFGWDQFKPNAPVQGASWICTTAPGHHADLDAVFAAGCRSGAQLIANTVAPNCWDGKTLDSADHRSHVAYADYSRGDGIARCPASHPFVIPQEENKVSFTVTADMIGANGKSRVSLSSDHMLPGARPGQTLHADYMEGWTDAGRKAWHNGCIDNGLDCSGGDLGNGLQLIGASEPGYGWINPRARVAGASGH